MKIKGFLRDLAGITAVLGAVAFIIYVCYALIYQYFDLAVFAAYVIGIGLIVGYKCFNTTITDFFNLLAVISFSFGLGLFFLNSYPVWADRLNNITMYGSRGTLFPVILIMVLTILAIIMGIGSCFAERRVSCNEE